MARFTAVYTIVPTPFDEAGEQERSLNSSLAVAS